MCSQHVPPITTSGGKNETRSNEANPDKRSVSIGNLCDFPADLRLPAALRSLTLDGGGGGSLLEGLHALTSLMVTSYYGLTRWHHGLTQHLAPMTRLQRVELRCVQHPWSELRAALLGLPLLQSLTLRDVDVGERECWATDTMREENAPIVAHVLRNGRKPLRKVHLVDTELGDRGVRVLCEALATRQLPEAIELSEANLVNPTEALRPLASKAELVELDLRGNALCATELAEFLREASVPGRWDRIQVVKVEPVARAPHGTLKTMLTERCALPSCHRLQLNGLPVKEVVERWAHAGFASAHLGRVEALDLREMGAAALARFVRELAALDSPAWSLRTLRLGPLERESLRVLSSAPLPPSREGH